jgi:hypothetical protein
MSAPPRPGSAGASGNPGKPVLIAKSSLRHSLTSDGELRCRAFRGRSCHISSRGRRGDPRLRGCAGPCSLRRDAGARTLDLATVARMRSAPPTNAAGALRHSAVHVAVRLTGRVADEPSFVKGKRAALPQLLSAKDIRDLSSSASASGTLDPPSPNRPNRRSHAAAHPLSSIPLRSTLSMGSFVHMLDIQRERASNDTDDARILESQHDLLFAALRLGYAAAGGGSVMQQIVRNKDQFLAWLRTQIIGAAAPRQAAKRSRAQAAAQARPRASTARSAASASHVRARAVCERARADGGSP